ELLLLTKAAHRGLAPVALLVAETLTAVIPNACPTGEVRVSDVHPNATVRSQTVFRSIEDLHQVLHVPFREWLKPEPACVAPIPVVGRRAVGRPAVETPRLENIPRVRHAVSSMPPVRWAGQDQVHVRARNCSKQIERITFPDGCFASLRR